MINYSPLGSRNGLRILYGSENTENGMVHVQISVRVLGVSTSGIQSSFVKSLLFYQDELVYFRLTKQMEKEVNTYIVLGWVLERYKYAWIDHYFPHLQTTHL